MEPTEFKNTAQHVIKFMIWTRFYPKSLATQNEVKEDVYDKRTQ